MVAQGQEGNAILEVAPLPIALGAASAATDGSVIYVFGGASASGTLDSIYRYSPLTDTWTLMSGRLPTAAAYTSAAWVGQHAYVVGVGDAIVKYDPSTDVASTVARLPAARPGAAAVSDGQVVWIFGGDAGAGTSADIFRFDPATSVVEKKGARLVHPVAYAAAVWAGDHALLAGGQPTRTSPEDLRGIRFDPATLQSTEVGGHSPHDGMSGAYYDQLFFTFGGRAGRFVYDRGISRVEEPFGGGSVEGVYLPGSGRAFSVAALVGDTIYVIGGMTQTGYTDSVARVVPALLPGGRVATPGVLPTTDARLPREETWWTPGWEIAGTATRCDVAHSPNGENVISMFLEGFEGTIRATDAGAPAGSQRTGRWDLVIATVPDTGSCAPGSILITGSASEWSGFVVALDFAQPISTRASDALILGPGTKLSASGRAQACAPGSAPDTLRLAGYAGELTGRYLVPRHIEQGPTQTTTFEGSWGLVLARPVSAARCDAQGASFDAANAQSGLMLVALNATSMSATQPQALPASEARMPRDVTWWGSQGWRVSGNAQGCTFTNDDGKDRVHTGYLQDFAGTITGVHPLTGERQERTGRWSFVVLREPSNGSCDGGAVTATGQSSESDGFAVAMNLSWSPVITPDRNVFSIALGPGSSVSASGSASACARLADGSVALTGLTGEIAGRDTSRAFTPQNDRTTFRDSWDIFLAHPAAAESCTSEGVLVTGGTSTQRATALAINFTGAAAPDHPTGTPAPPTPPTPTARTPCYDLLSCPIGDVSSIRSRILGVRGQVVSAAGAAVAGAPVLLLGERDGALDLLSITQTLADGSFSVPTAAAPPAYAATVMGGHVVLADLAAREGGIPADGLLSLRLPVPEAAAAAQHSALSEPEIQLLADAFQTAKPFGIPRAAPDAPANVPIGYAGIRGVAVRPTTPQEDARVVIVDMKDKGSPRIPDPPGGPRAKYFALQVADIAGNEVPLTRIEFEFEAPEGSEGKDVLLHHFLLEEQRWETLKTQRTEAGTYAAGVDSLSLFAISTSQPSALGALVQAAFGSPLTLPILGGVLVVGIAAVALNRARAARGPSRAPVAGAASAAIRAQPLPEREAIVSDLGVSAKGTKILQGVSFAFGQGEILALLGPSGSGKSTLLKALLGETSFTGEASLFGIDPARRDPAHKKLVGYVSQETELYPDMTLRENVEYFGKQYGLTSAEIKARVPSLLHTLGLAERSETRVGLLSGGQQRRASIAATLVHGPSLLILDEPTSGLDPVTRKSLWKFVRQASRELGVTVIVTTHFLDEADLADRVVILNKGTVVKAGTPQELVRSLPGGGKAVVVELQASSPAIEARVREAVRPLEARGVVAGSDLSGYTARFFTPNAQTASRDLLDAFGQAEVPVKQVTTEDCGMDAVFTFYAGERWKETDA